MTDQGEHYQKAWILHHILNRMIGSREMVDIRRKMILVDENVERIDEDIMESFKTGSKGEGFLMEGSDVDLMLIDKGLKVMCSNHGIHIPSDNRDESIAVMRKSDCRPCYVTLELLQAGRCCEHKKMEFIIPIRGRLFISSEIYAKSCQEVFHDLNFLQMENHGPSSCLKNENSNMGCDFDFVLSYCCTDWPPEANEWLSRPRQHGWPKEELIHDISQSGCHVVPIGDKTSADSFLQWRISFVTAERKLIHSLRHEQFLVFGLLKYFLKQISGMLKQSIGDVDILSSYIMKTVLFFAVESTPESFWEEQNTFLCFRLCLKILIAWVSAGHCPNYFIVNNNMFQGKLHAGNQEKLLRFLIDMYDLGWKCLSIGTFIQPSIGERVQRVMNREWEYVLVPPKTFELEYDDMLFTRILASDHVRFAPALTLLSKSKSDIDEFIAYIYTVKSLSNIGIETFGKQQAARSNKQKYKFLRKCKSLMTPFASASTSPGLLTLATFFYQTGNYTKALMACGAMFSSSKWFFGQRLLTDEDNYQQMFRGRRYTLLHKCQEVVVDNVALYKDISALYPCQLHQELEKCLEVLRIPPLPYAVFLSFLCHHEQGDRRRRDTALRQLRAVKYDEKQGSSKFWIVNNLLGICFEMVGDPRRAIREYHESLSDGKTFQQYNPARERIARLHTVSIKEFLSNN